ncbi:hypothetical protein C2857_003653 [Epichloe festucae Fl1]|uniref:Uncharacterized protein n=1 Tax=Epichloe festucae (strain Fl1) TaxID=877507 RepID=A0A7U3Q230_EPIFF|nr:hypothetical protein C2857_003653 [Epichloe festucae Fl1]
MPPIPRGLVIFTQRIRNSALRNRTLNLIERATQEQDLAHFTKARLKNPSHTSRSDPIPHVTVLLSTDTQTELDRAQAVHIYHDEDWNYKGHTLYEERINKSTDD